MRNRYYSGSSGRFVSRDPLGIWGDPFQVGNGYSYTKNNPVNWRDDLGKQPAPYPFNDTHDNCDAHQIDALNSLQECVSNAFRATLADIRAAKATVAGGGAVPGNLTAAFGGGLTADDVDFIRYKIEIMEAYFKSEWEFECDNCCPRNVTAYMRPMDDEVNLCSLFWNLTCNGKGEVIFHEVSHYAGTDDYAYEWERGGANLPRTPKTWGTMTRKERIDNADNYETYFDDFVFCGGCRDAAAFLHDGVPGRGRLPFTR